MISGIILAGGLGKRMKSELPKVCHLLYGKPMVEHVKCKMINLGIQTIGIIVGQYIDDIKMHVTFPNNVQWLIQEQPCGTGDALKCGITQMMTTDEYILVMSGDAPFIAQKTIQNIVNKCTNEKMDACILTCEVSDPRGYGRIITDNDDNNNFVKIVEEKDTTNNESKISNINAGVYVFNKHSLLEHIHMITNNNSQREFYLTDIFEILKQDDKKVGIYQIFDENEIFNINTKKNLENAGNSNLGYLVM
jgi:UDP-N-acetylglucosamine diphosphorylase/glucosamine-1-phosphate N-acetyltransferase